MIADRTAGLRTHASLRSECAPSKGIGGTANFALKALYQRADARRDPVA